MNMNPRINLIQENYEKIVSFFSQKLSFIKFLKIYQIPEHLIKNLFAKLPSIKLLNY